MTSSAGVDLKQEKLDFFFGDKHLSTSNNLKGIHSTLRLALNDISQLREAGKDERLIFPWASTLLTAIDLCGTLYAGVCGIGTNSKNFTKFVDEVLFFNENLSGPDTHGKIIYDLRNGIMHSYRITSERLARKENEPLTYSFVVNARRAETVILTGPAVSINLSALMDRFTGCLDSLKRALQNPAKIDGAIAMFDKYGWMAIGCPPPAGQSGLEHLNELLMKQ